MSVEIAIVTGAASGVGARTAQRLVRGGTPVVAIDRGWAAEVPSDVVAVRGDTTLPETWDEALAAARRLGGRPTKLVLNAAHLAVGTILEVDEQELRRVFEVNVFAAALGLRRCLPTMVAAGGGRVVAVASVAGLVAEQGLSAYCASKGALVQLIRCVAVDHARAGVRANCVCPGAIDTPFFRRHLAAASEPDRFLREKIDRHPSGRLLTPDDVAAVIEFLLAEASAGINGAAVTVDGALTATFDFQASGVSSASTSAKPRPGCSEG